VYAKYASKPHATALEIAFRNKHPETAVTVLLMHHAYGFPGRKENLRPASDATIVLDLTRSFGWYDFIVRVEGVSDFERRYAGHVETGQQSFSDPAMGQVRV
jgi:phospholipase C